MLDPRREARLQRQHALLRNPRERFLHGAVGGDEAAFVRGHVGFFGRDVGGDFCGESRERLAVEGPGGGSEPGERWERWERARERE